MSSEGFKNRNRIDLNKKLQIIEKIDEGWSESKIVEEMGVSKDVISRVKRARQQLKSMVNDGAFRIT